MKEENLAVVVGYIMYYNMLEEEMNGSFFTKIDKAIEIAKEFCSFYSAEEESGWSNDLDFEETLNEFVTSKIKK